MGAAPKVQDKPPKSDLDILDPDLFAKTAR
jgi:hypothetical protein